MTDHAAGGREWLDQVKEEIIDPHHHLWRRIRWFKYIECFGPNRCMFESNYPVDRLSISYHVLWN